MLVEIRRPDFEPLQIVQSIVGSLLQPLVVAGLVIVFVIMILLEREDLRDRVLRLAGRRDLHRTTVWQRTTQRVGSAGTCCGNSSATPAAVCQSVSVSP